jgi:hypothetical protein
VLLLAILITQIFAASALTPIIPGSPATTLPPVGVDPRTPLIEWYLPDGYSNMLTLANNPEYLKLWTNTYVHSTTTIIVQGKDVRGENLEAKVVIPQGTDASSIFVFMDTHTDPPCPVAFSEVTGILQQNGTHCNSFLIYTEPFPFEQYIGVYKPDGNDPTFNHGYTPNYYEPRGDNNPPTLRTYPVEPANPDPIKILLNWHDKDGDLYPDFGVGPPGNNNGEMYPQVTTQKAIHTATIFIEGLDQRGNKLIISVLINAGESIVYLGNGGSPNDPVFSTICKVWGGAVGDEYYIFTEPQVERPLFTYRLRIHHMSIQPASYDILANPDPAINEGKLGQTEVTVALRDIDDHFLHWGDANPANYIIVNFATSGGKIQPSNDVRIYLCHVTASATLYADTNARTIRVSASANVPPIAGKCPAMNLFAWTEMTFDGINSVRTISDGVIHTMMWGYHTDLFNSTSGTYTIPSADFSGPVPPKPWLPTELGGPEPTDVKYDGPIYEVMIPLFVGCNLISCPVHPILGSDFHTGYPTVPNNNGIPMEYLFGETSAQDCIEAIWWYEAVNGATSSPQREESVETPSSEMA